MFASLKWEGGGRPPSCIPRSWQFLLSHKPSLYSKSNLKINKLFSIQINTVNASERERSISRTSKTDRYSQQMISNPYCIRTNPHKGWELYCNLQEFICHKKCLKYLLLLDHVFIKTSHFYDHFYS